MLCLTLILHEHRVLRDGIEQTGTVHTDGRLESHLVVGRFGIGVESRSVDGHIRIDQAVALSVGELHRQTRRHGGHVFPGDMDTALIDGSFERFHGFGLRHARDLRDVTVSGISLAVGIGACRGVIDDEQITIAHLVGPIFGLALAMAVARMTVLTAGAHPGGT